MYIFRIGIHFYIVGIIILSLGIALCIESLLGASPYDALLVGLFRTFGLTIGSWEVIVGAAMLIGNCIAEKRMPEWMAFITSILTGIGIDVWLFVLQPSITPSTWSMKAVFLIAGIIFTAIGTSLYLQSRIAPNPMDRSMLIIVEKLGWSISKARILIGVLLVTLAFIFGGAIGIGTIANALLTGVLIGIFIPYAHKLQVKFTPSKRTNT